MQTTLTLPPNWSSLPEEFRRRLGSTVGRQRLMQAQDNLLIVAHHVPEPDEAMRRGILFWRDASGEWRSSNGDPGKAALEMHLKRYAKRVDEIEHILSKANIADDFLPLLESLAPLVRSCRNLFETLDEARKAAPEDRSLIDHRDRAYELSRQADLLYEEAKNSLDVAMVRRADQQALTTHQMMLAAHRLNILAALFFPFAILGSILGTTLTDNWTWSHSAIPFVLYVVAGSVIGLLLTRFISRV
ncbi:MAG: hypothetical protein ACK5OB_14385 [Pirellula sp.]